MGHLLSRAALRYLRLSLDMLGAVPLFLFGIPSKAELDGVLT